MASIRLPPVLTPAVLRAVAANLARCFEEWADAERRHERGDVLARLQESYERANAAYKEALDRAEREGVADAAPHVEKQR